MTKIMLEMNSRGAVGSEKSESVERLEFGSANEIDIRRLRILLVSGNYAPELTGIGKYNGDMTDWLVQQGHQVTVVTLPPHYPEWKIHPGFSAYVYSTERNPGLVVHRCPAWIPNKPRGIARIIFLASFAISSLPVILIAVFRNRPDVVFVTEPPLLCAPFALFAAKLRRTRCWLHVQDLEIDAAFSLGQVRSPTLQRLAVGFEKVVLQAFDHVTTISETMLERVRAKGVSVQRSSLFPNWSDMERIHFRHSRTDARAEFGLPMDKFIVMYSGNLGQKQGLEVIVHAAARLKDDNRVLFVIAGAGSALETLKAMAAGLSNVRFVPLIPTAQYGNFLSTANAHVLPQRTDIEDLVLPSKVTSMLASGRPIVALARPDTALARVCCKAGFVCAPGDPTALVDVIVWMIGESAELERIGRAARAYAEQELEKANILKRVWNSPQILGEPS